MRKGTHPLLLLYLALIGCSVTGCGASISADHSPTAAPTYGGFGATDAAWNANHQVDNKFPNQAAYLPFIPSRGGGEDGFAAVNHSGGRVTGWIMAFPDGTPLEISERTLIAQLPPDTKQVASFAALSADGTSACELVNYQSAMLAQWLGPNRWGDTQGDIGTAFYKVNADGSGSLSTHEVNTASVDIAPNSPSSTC